MNSKSGNTQEKPRVANRPMPASFDAWRADVRTAGMRPEVVIAGSRGKTTVARLLDAVFHEAGLRTALWTDLGVEIEGIRQRGELVPWSRVTAGLDDGSIDIAIREVAWSTVRTAGLRIASAPIVVVTNVCANREACLIHEDAKIASESLPTLVEAASPFGLVVLNGEDFAVSGADVPYDRPRCLVALNRDTPIAREHVRTGGDAAWVEDGTLVLANLGAITPIERTDRLPFALYGAAAFQLHNALNAAAVATAIGITPEPIARGLRTFRPSPRAMPGSFNVVEANGATVIVERPEPSWFLRSVLRAVKDRAAGRLITVAGRLDRVPAPDVVEVGRLLGRVSTALILHSELEVADRSASFRQGVALNDVPPPIVHTPSERRAVSRALTMVRPRDTLLVLADRPASVLRALTRGSSPKHREVLAAD